MASLFKRNGWYYLQFYSTKRSPKRKQVALKTQSKRAAKKLQSRLQDEYRLGEYDPWKDDGSDESADLSRLEDTVDEFLKAKSHLSDKYHYMLTALLGLFKEFRTPQYSTATLASKDIVDFLDSTDTGTVSKHTYVRHLKVFVRWLVMKGVLETDITKEIGLKRAPSKFPKYLMPDEIRDLMDAIDSEAEENPYVKEEHVEWLKPLIRRAVYLGLRRSEICNLRWQDMDLDKELLTVANHDGFTTKTGYDRMNPIPKKAMPILKDLHEKWAADGRETDFVFTHTRGRIQPEYLSKRFAYFRRKASLPDKITFHSLRHTTDSWLMMRGASIEAVRQYLGHSSIRVTEKYAHLAPNVFRDQVTSALDAISHGS